MAALVKCRALAATTRSARLALRSFSATAARKNEGSNVSTPTHTGQVWEEKDYRRLRFMDKEKLVNRQFAIDLIADDPVVVVNSNHVFSDSGGALGHPKVYINLDKPEFGVCGYSGRKFIQAKFYDKAKHGPSISYDEYLREDKPEFGVCGYSGRKFIQAKFYDKAKHGPSISYDEYLREVRPAE